VMRQGAVHPLVVLLAGGSAATQAYAAQALANMARCTNADAQTVVAKAGAIPPLLRLLSDARAQTPAAGCLAMLVSNNSGVQQQVASAGGIPPLLALLNGRNIEAQVQAAAALSELAKENPDIQAQIVRAGGIGPLLALSGSFRSTAAMALGTAALARLAHQNPSNQDAIARQGGIKALVDNLGSPHGSEDPRVLANAATALMELCRSNHANQAAVANHTEAISLLASLVKNSMHMSVKAECAGALWSLSQDPKIKTMIARAFAIPPLVALLSSTDQRACELASDDL